MTVRKKEFEIFNLSFLDIISCGFGAVVLLVLISKPMEEFSKSGIDEAGALLSQVIALETRIDTLDEAIDQQNRNNNEQLTESGGLHQATMTLSQQLGRREEEEKNLRGDLEGLSLVKDSLKQASIAPSSTKTTRDEEVGGIPVDSDYVIFVVDTSGSMREIWARISKEILNVLSIHPQVKGFQILNDQGKSLISAYSGRWIPDTPQRRKGVMKVFKAWNDASNSSPIEGIETALQRYAKPGRSLSIYVFGDDYTGSSYDPVIGRITKMNRGGKAPRLAKIHGVGFISRHTTNRFAILMREVTKRNGGTFLALPR
uniref:von Willebrand factor type A domain-containing protein n=1 Tax=Candidatus Kentrum sp. TUN TaxID=2126343 RepID=A0A450ZQK9_9GAMM|nr:MAG: hypothetical protein BECKTUN1418F_GA0071002_107814 [Candidatus Kentron sp. TUN]VFK58209.1 MAG: hypothetical protein BECKTUN1418D_GA0071000_10783 [Candidatus Kentron sp. TUN]VFK62181.1 MAG: hypothetical protein BECKTUN1418E_GA0071001_107514 [Candidatus Kentron sp. TUN]